MMKSKQWDLVLLLGAMCFVVEATVMVFGYLDQPWKFSLNVLGLISHRCRRIWKEESLLRYLPIRLQYTRKT